MNIAILNRLEIGAYIKPLVHLFGFECNLKRKIDSCFMALNLKAKKTTQNDAIRIKSYQNQLGHKTFSHTPQMF